MCTEMPTATCAGVALGMVTKSSAKQRTPVNFLISISESSQKWAPPGEPAQNFPRLTQKFNPETWRKLQRHTLRAALGTAGPGQSYAQSRRISEMMIGDFSAPRVLWNGEELFPGNARSSIRQ